MQHETLVTLHRLLLSSNVRTSGRLSDFSPSNAPTIYQSFPVNRTLLSLVVALCFQPLIVPISRSDDGRTK